MENKIREGERAQTEFEKISKRIDEKISELYKTLEPVIISTIQDKNKEMSLRAQSRSRKPILLKIAPDLTDDQLLDIIEIVAITKIDGSS